MVIAATVKALGVLAAIIALTLRRQRASGLGPAFMDSVALALAFLGSTAVRATVLPALLLASCLDVA